ncbi:MAG: GNAT family N-acetyltransferase [Cyclobacteriaceae bacterium]
MNTEVAKLSNKDLSKFQDLILIFEDVFELEDFKLPPESHLQSLLDRENFLVFVAMNLGKVIGGITLHVLPQYYSESPEAYLYDLAVKTEFQRKGIGKELMNEVKNYCKQVGIETAYVQADVEDDHAVAFYNATGGSPQKVIHFNYPTSE